MNSQIHPDLIRSPLARQASTAFCAPCIDNLAATFSCHTCTESVRACALDAAWLESSFHVGMPLAKDLKKARRISSGVLVVNENLN